MKIKNMEPAFIPTYGAEVKGRLVCMELAHALVQASVFFAVEPMPNDVWAFYVKSEAVGNLKRMHEVAMEAARERCNTCDALTAGHEPRNCQILKSTHSCKFIEEM